MHFALDVVLPTATTTRTALPTPFNTNPIQLKFIISGTVAGVAAIILVSVVLLAISCAVKRVRKKVVLQFNNGNGEESGAM